MPNNLIVVLDAMGVIYKEKDDVKNLLFPFIRKHVDIDFELVNSLYLSASLGIIDEDSFWKEVGLDPSYENDYIKEFELTDCVISFLQNLNSYGLEIAVLSNDVGRWSKKLRSLHNLDKYIQHWIISGDHKVRKPDKNIFQLANAIISTSSEDTVFFVDDRLANIYSANALGWNGVYFCSKNNINRHVVCSHDFNDVLSIINSYIGSK